MFLAGEADDEESSSLVTVLDVIMDKWPYGAKSSDIAGYASEMGGSGAAFRAAIELASGKGMPTVTATSVTWRLKALVDAPVSIGGKVFCLRYLPDRTKSGGTFGVKPI
jgi:hypothetical protein